jgi:hypothetical protein
MHEPPKTWCGFAPTYKKYAIYIILSIIFFQLFIVANSMNLSLNLWTHMSPIKFNNRFTNSLYGDD